MIRLTDLIRSRCFVLAIQLRRGSSVGELGLLIDEVGEAFGDYCILEDHRLPA